MVRPRLYQEQRRATAVRLPAPLHDRLRAEAHARQVSANLLVERAIADYLDRLPPLELALPPSAGRPTGDRGDRGDRADRRDPADG